MWIDCEGIDGSGKTTVSLRLAERLRGRGLRVYQVRENGTFRSRLAGRIRELTRNPDSVALAPEAELLLNTAREAQVLAEEIRPALARGEIVITDRGLHGHVVLAQWARALPAEGARRVAEFAARNLWPDVVLLVDVDPDVARLRRRLRKIRDRRLGSSGRKGLLGPKLGRVCREGFLAMAAADPSRWQVLENSWRSVEEAEAEAFALVAPRLGLPAGPRPAPAAAPRVGPAGTPEEWVRNFFDFAAAVSRRDPAIAALYVAGLEDPRAEAILEAALEKAPEVAAWCVGGLSTPAAWKVRREAVDRAPYHVARSLTGLQDELAWAWRARLAREAPDQVLHALSGLAEPEAHAMRQRLWEYSPEEGLRSLAGLGDPSAWALRCRALRHGTSAALAESLADLDTESAWALFDRLREEYPLSVLKSVPRVDHPRAWRVRADLLEAAPRAVLKTIRGLDSDRAGRVRDTLEREFPEDVAASLAGLDTPGAWQARERLIDEAPGGVLASLAGLAADPRSRTFVDRALARSEGQPRIARKAVLLQQAVSSEAAWS